MLESSVTCSCVTHMSISSIQRSVFRKLAILTTYMSLGWCQLNLDIAHHKFSLIYVKQDGRRNLLMASQQDNRVKVTYIFLADPMYLKLSNIKYQCCNQSENIWKSITGIKHDCLQVQATIAIPNYISVTDGSAD